MTPPNLFCYLDVNMPFNRTLTQMLKFFNSFYLVFLKAIWRYYRRFEGKKGSDIQTYTTLRDRPVVKN